MNQIKVYDYIKVKNHVRQLLRIYKTNDLRTNKAEQERLLDEIEAVFSVHDIDVKEEVMKLDDKQLSKAKAEQVLHHLKQYVEPFEMPSQNEMERLFKKVKKLKVPNPETIDTQLISYIGWNDVSAHRKFIIYKDQDEQLHGIYGELSPTKVKGFCKICNKESDVSLFLNKTKASADGTYTKKGDYICHHSEVCNDNLDDIQHLYDFVDHISK
ncbi:hypothetical protein ERX27_02565 [Macrococcus brunensis]|uniref:Elongation factor G-binding protein n=1 Tax=Macrococcus brunensis TaxID=198483 RepID=A0A4R6BFN5_9STAP|nr:FusB/FusC family EF-G-binding protein [Macrococcus brunensis]TDL98677.1 hypothetical protein ERX27_02565 [Macrococcus brunensis]ULG71418.1 FusB/FusC family EF-G-binding protein [Macrococcus brunensis]ULG73714.1 FusB/FusC family EF-G-binding protein [Macrococcus brunensis]